MISTRKSRTTIRCSFGQTHTSISSSSSLFLRRMFDSSSLSSRDRSSGTETHDGENTAHINSCLYSYRINIPTQLAADERKTKGALNPMLSKLVEFTTRDVKWKIIIKVILPLVKWSESTAASGFDCFTLFCWSNTYQEPARSS